MDRRNENAISGHVNFPTERIPSSGEGGTLVRLVVLPKENQEFTVCSGGFCYIYYDESFIDDDDISTTPFPKYPGDNASPEALSQWVDLTDSRRKSATNTHFPRMDIFGDLLSTPYLAVILMGTTGWTPSERWVCQYSDLTAAGKRLYDMVKDLYGDAGNIRLQTWIDT